MRTLTGAILILSGEQAFAHAYLVPFPYQVFAQTILIPFAAIAVLVGLGFLIFGFFSDRKPT